MSSFFTTPASQLKRKREDIGGTSSAKRRITNVKATKKVRKSSRHARDESISGSGSENDSKGQQSEDGEGKVSTDSDEEDETGAERRLRLAEKYLQKIKGGVDDIGFDAEEIDRDLIAERLKEDVAESKGRLYRHIADDLDFPAASKTLFRTNTLSTTSIAVCPPYVYTVSKDITLVKWELANPPAPPSSKKRKPPKNPPPPPRKRPLKICSTKGIKRRANDKNYWRHTKKILTVAASSSGKFVVTGGLDKRLIVWSAADLIPLRVFTQHRDAVTSLAFRRGTHQLYSGSKDRTIKTWSLDELAYVETLFGHQDEVIDLAALAQERCVSVGGRDRTARLWKVAEETQLVFRGGGGGGRSKDEQNRRPREPREQPSSALPSHAYLEGSIERIALIDEETFITGSDNGALSLWNIHKKKPVFTVPLAHGLDPQLLPEEASAEEIPSPNVPGVPQPRWITALATVPYSDLILSGSWDGWVRVWRVSADKKRIESVGVLGAGAGAQGPNPVDNTGSEGAGLSAQKAHEDNTNLPTNEGDDGDDDLGPVKGIMNDIALFERGERGKQGLCVVVATGREHRLGSWMKMPGKDGAVVFEVPRLRTAKGGKQGQAQGKAEGKGTAQKIDEK